MKGAGGDDGGGCRAPRAGPGDSSVPLGEPVEAVEGMVPGTLTCPHSTAQAVQDRCAVSSQGILEDSTSQFQLPS